MKQFLNANWETVRGLLVAHSLRIAIIILGAFLAYRITKLAVRKFRESVEDDDPTTRSELEKRADTLGRIVQQVSAVAILLVAGMLLMKELGFEIGPLIAGAGIAGVAVGFGAQNLVRDIITGFFLLLENQIRVGDVVEVSGKSGLVEELNLRTTVLRGIDGSVHVVPNGAITTVTNMTREWSRALLDIGVAYKESVDRVIQTLKEIGAEMGQDPKWKPFLIDSLEIPGVNEFGDSAVVVRIMQKTIPLKQWEVSRELRRRIKNRFDELGIEIPFPHVTLYVGEGAQGTFLHRPILPSPEETRPEAPAAVQDPNGGDAPRKDEPVA